MREDGDGIAEQARAAGILRLGPDRRVSPARRSIIQRRRMGSHPGFNTAYARANPNFVLPLDAMKEMAAHGYGQLHDHFDSMPGVGTSLTVAQRAGEEIAASMRDKDVDVALLVAT